MRKDLQLIQPAAVSLTINRRLVAGTWQIGWRRLVLDLLDRGLTLVPKRVVRLVERCLDRRQDRAARPESLGRA